MEDAYPCDFCCLPQSKCPGPGSMKCGALSGDQEATEEFNKYAKECGGVEIIIDPEILCHIDYLDTGESGWSLIKMFWLPSLMKDKMAVVNY